MNKLKELDIATPYLAVDKTIVEANIARVMNYGAQHGFNVRPHIKTHKSRQIAQLQLAAGSKKLAVSKVSEAEPFLSLPFDDLLVAYPAIGKHRVEKLAQFATKKTLLVTADSCEQIDNLGLACENSNTFIGILIEVNTGLNRCGIKIPQEAAAIISAVKKYRHLSIAGAMLYNGHLWGPKVDDDATYKEINSVWEPIYEELVNSTGHSDLLISSASTPSLFNSHRIKHVNEIRYGSCVYYDYWLMKNAPCTLADCAARVVTTVVSNSVPGFVMIDAGSKAISPHYVWGLSNQGYGYIVEYPDALLFKLHEEIGWIDISRCENAPKLGERITIVPASGALTVNQYDAFYFVDQKGNSTKTLIDARGLVQ